MAGWAGTQQALARRKAEGPHPGSREPPGHGAEKPSVWSRPRWPERRRRGSRPGGLGPCAQGQGWGLYSKWGGHVTDLLPAGREMLTSTFLEGRLGHPGNWACAGAGGAWSQGSCIGKGWLSREDVGRQPRFSSATFKMWVGSAAPSQPVQGSPGP